MFMRNVVFVLLSLAGIHRTVFGTVPVGLGRTMSINVNLFVTFVKLRGTGVMIGGSSALMDMFSFGSSMSNKAFGARKVAILLTLVKLLVATVLLMGGMGKGVL